MLFLSRGSNYTMQQAWRHMLTRGQPADSQALQAALTERYGGSSTVLFARGRGALSEAVRLATGGSGYVAVTALTCYVVVEAIRTAGCQPLFIDVDRQTWQFSADQLAVRLRQQPVKAVIVQNTLGIATDITAIERLAEQEGFAIIEDLAHAVGGRYADGREMGTVGDYTMVSFGRDKLLDTINGGALILRTDQSSTPVRPANKQVAWTQQLRDRLYPVLACLVRGLMPIGLGKYLLAVMYRTGLAVRSADGGTQADVQLPHWQAALALQQLQQLDSNVARRLDKQQQYLQHLAAYSPQHSSNAVRLPLMVENRDQVVKQLKQSGYWVEDMWYEVPVSPARLYQAVDFPEADCPVAVALAARTINLPTHQLVHTTAIRTICQIVQREALPWN